MSTHDMPLDRAAPLTRLRCSACGYGASVRRTPDRCPMCGTSAWLVLAVVNRFSERATELFDARAADEALARGAPAA